MGTRIKHLARRDGGQALVELSLTAGFLCLMLLAVWQVGTIFSNYIDISEAARSGARAAALSGAPTTTNDAPSLAAVMPELLDAVGERFPRIRRMQIELRKLNPPTCPGHPAYAAVRLIRGND